MVPTDKKTVGWTGLNPVVFRTAQAWRRRSNQLSHELAQVIGQLLVLFILDANTHVALLTPKIKIYFGNYFAVIEHVTLIVRLYRLFNVS